MKTLSSRDIALPPIRKDNEKRSEFFCILPQFANSTKILFLKMIRSDAARTVHLRGIWFDAPVTADAIVHVIGDFEPTGKCIIDNANNMLILHPDHLIAATSIGDSFGCTRRAVLQDRVKATSESSMPLLYGTIIHEIFQAAIFANRWDSDWLSDKIQQCVGRHLEDLYAIRIDAPRAVGDLQDKMPVLQAWAELFVAARPQVKPNEARYRIVMLTLYCSLGPLWM